MTGDRNPLHYNQQLAEESAFGKLIVQGGVTSGILNALVAEDLPGLEQFSFLSNGNSSRRLALTKKSQAGLRSERSGRTSPSAKSRLPCAIKRVTYVSRERRPPTRFHFGNTKSHDAHNVA